MTFPETLLTGAGGYLFVLVAVGAALTNLCFMLGAGAAVGAGDVGLLLGLRLHPGLLLRAFELGALEGDAAHDGFCDFFVTNVAFDHIGKM